MKKYVEYAVVAIIGFVFGWGCSSMANKARYNEKMNSELESMHEYYERRSEKKAAEASVEMTPPEKTKDYTEGPPQSPMEVREMLDDVLATYGNADIEIISEDDFDPDDENYENMNLYLYSDGIISDDFGSVFVNDDLAEFISHNVADLFTEDNDILFIRNNVTSMVYIIYKEETPYESMYDINKTQEYEDMG